MISSSVAQLVEMTVARRLVPGGGVLRPGLEFLDAPPEALPDRVRAAGQHLLVPDHEETERVVLLSQRAVIAIAKVGGYVFIQRKLSVFERHRDLPGLTRGEAADLCFAVADQRPGDRMLVDEAVHQTLAFLLAGQDGSSLSSPDAELAEHRGVAADRFRPLGV